MSSLYLDPEEDFGAHNDEYLGFLLSTILPNLAKELTIKFFFGNRLLIYVSFLVGLIICNACWTWSNIYQRVGDIYISFI